MKKALPQLFKQELQRLGADLTQPFVVAVSGGIDSVVLCALCHQIHLKFTVLHCNFGLRGEESNRDEAFVKALGANKGVEVLVQHFDTAAYAANEKLSIQEAARQLRYNWFEEKRKQKGAGYILLGHHANDNIETVLMHFFRGTGLQGLTGIPGKGSNPARILRPLLPFTRKELEIFANEEALSWVEDASNQQDIYTRNFFRNQLIPQVQMVYPQVEEALLQNIRRFEETNALYQGLVQKEKEKLILKKGGEFRVGVKKLMAYQRTSMLYEVIKDFNFGEGAIGELIKLADAPSGKYIESETHRIIRHRAWFIIAPGQPGESETFVLENNDRQLYLPEGILEIEKIDSQHIHLKKDAAIAQIDFAHLHYPLLIRRWKAGDYFYPLGMPKKKKLARFFIDLKLSTTDKENVWVLESAGRIVWVVGHRIDDRFKVMPHTKQVLQLTLKA